MLRRRQQYPADLCKKDVRYTYALFTGLFAKSKHFIFDIIIKLVYIGALMWKAWNEIQHPSAEARAAYAKQHADLRKAAYADANARLPQILENIHPRWSKRAVFCEPISEQTLQDYREQWLPAFALPEQFGEAAQQRTLSHFDWDNSARTYEGVLSRFEVAVYVGDRLTAMSYGGWRNWHGDLNGRDVKTNVVCIDTVEAAPHKGLVSPGLSLVAIAEAARSYARLTDRDVFALNGPSSRMEVLLQGVGFPKMRNLDVYMMPVEDLDRVWENLAQYLREPREKLPYSRVLEEPDIVNMLALEDHS